MVWAPERIAMRSGVSLKITISLLNGILRMGEIAGTGEACNSRHLAGRHRELCALYKHTNTQVGFYYLKCASYVIRCA